MVLAQSFFPGETALLVPRTDDGRVLFAIPWHGRVLVGTTDTPVTDVANEPRPLHEEIGYLLGYLDRYLVEDHPKPGDVLSTSPVCARSCAARSAHDGQALARARRDGLGSGLVTITGGKWTTYRRMAIDAVDHAVRSEDSRPHVSATRRSNCTAGAESDASGDRGPWPFTVPMHPPSPRFATNALSGLNCCIRRCPIASGEVIWAARHEAARSVGDVLARRTLQPLSGRSGQHREPRTEGAPADCWQTSWQDNSRRSGSWQPVPAEPPKFRTPDADLHLLALVDVTRLTARSTPSDRSR